MVKKKTNKTLSLKTKELIEKMIKTEISDRKIQNQIRIQLKEKVTQKIITQFRTKTNLVKEKNPAKQSTETKKVFKITGATIINEFLERVKEGDDVSSLQAVLEHAVYVDSLRRYVAHGEGLESLDIKDVIKITNDYRRLQINSAKAGIGEVDESNEKLSAALAVKLIELVESVFSNKAILREAFKKTKPSLTRKIARLVSQEEVPEIEILQRLNEKARRDN